MVRNEGGGKENEYLVEPRALNELGLQYESRGMDSGNASGAHMIKTSPPKSDPSTTRTYKPGRTLSATHAHSLGGQSHALPARSTASTQKYESSVRFTVPVPSSSPSTLHPSPPSQSHTITSPSTHHPSTSTTSPSDPYSVGPPRTRPTSTATTAPYSNATAVFGPPVKFGERATHVPSRQPTLVKPAEVSKIVKSLMHDHLFCWICRIISFTVSFVCL